MFVADHFPKLAKGGAEDRRSARGPGTRGSPRAGPVGGRRAGSGRRIPGAPELPAGAPGPRGRGAGPGPAVTSPSAAPVLPRCPGPRD